MFDFVLIYTEERLESDQLTAKRGTVSEICSMLAKTAQIVDREPLLSRGITLSTTGSKIL